MVGDKALSIRYLGDDSGLRKTLASIQSQHATLGSKIRGIGQSISGVGRSVSLGLTAPIALFGTKAIAAFSEADRVARQTEAVLRSTGGAAGVSAGQIRGLAERIGDLAAVDDDAVAGMENVLLTFTNIRNAGPDKIFNQAATAAANLSASLGQDLQSSAVQVGKALNDPVKGITALQRVGVSFTDKQRDLIARLTETGDTAGAQKVILRELATEFGGSAKAAGDAASPMQRLGLQFDDFAEKIGGLVLPIVQRLTGMFSSAMDWFNRLSPGAQRLAVTIGAIAAAAGPVLLIAGKVVSALGTIGTAFKGLTGVLAANPYVAIIAASIALVTLIVAKWDRIKEVLRAAWEKIKEVASSIWNGIKNVLTTVWEGIKTAIGTYVGLYKTAFKTAWEAIKTVAKTVWEAIKTVVVDPLVFIKDKIGDALSWIKDRWHSIWSGIKDFFGDVWDGIKSLARGAMNFVIDRVNDMINALNVLVDAIDTALGPFINMPAVPTIPNLARGTQSFRGGLAVVGERGPELVDLPRGSSVFPGVRTSAAALSGGDLHVHFGTGSTFVGTFPDRVADEIHEALLRKQRRGVGLGFH